MRRPFAIATPARRRGRGEGQGGLGTGLWAAVARSGRLDRVAPHIRAHPLPAFFLLAYGVSWGILLVLAGLLREPAAIAIATVGPSVGAWVVLTATDGKPARDDLVRRVRLWRVRPRWYLVALVGIPAACLAAAAVLPGGADALATPSRAGMAVTFLAYLVLGFFSGPLFEEPGWRGFALPRLEVAHGPLGGTLLLGVLWGAWHLPQFLVPAWAAENGGADPLTVIEFLLLVVALSPLLTWVYNSTGSLWIAMVVHASINASLAAVPAPPGGPMLVGLGAFVAIDLALVAATRGHLGYDAEAARRLAAADTAARGMHTSRSVT